MATISNCGSKGPSLRPSAFEEIHKTFPAATWVTVFEWSGSTDETLGFTVQVTGSNDPVVEWERYEDGDLVSSGSFQKAIDVVISPDDSGIEIKVRVSDEQASLDVECVVSAFQG